MGWTEQANRGKVRKASEGCPHGAGHIGACDECSRWFSNLRFLGEASTVERDVSVWEYGGRVMVAPVDGYITAEGLPSGMRLAPYGIAKAFKGEG